jgi:hypothetical protein
MMPFVRRSMPMLAAALLLGGCGSNDSASYLVDGTADRALSLFRDKAFPWSSSWNLQLVVTAQPDCQRRHTLKRAADGRFSVSVYRTPDGAYILNQGKRWYVTELRNCQLQQYEEPPPAPGDLVGAFEQHGGELGFVAAAAAVPSPSSPAPGGAEAPAAASPR